MLFLNNYPNPFNLNTTITYTIPVGNYVQLKVYDILGNEVATLVNSFHEAGSYSVEVDANNLPVYSGTYYYKLVAGDKTITKCMIKSN